MKRALLKEYIRLLVENIILEAGTIGTSASTSTGTTSSSATTIGSTGTATSKTTTGTGADRNQKETDESIQNIEDLVKANSDSIINNQKAINNAAKKLQTQTVDMISSTDKTATGLSSASQASKDLTKKQTPEETKSTLDNQAKSFNDAATGVRTTSDTLKKTLVTFQTLDSQTRSGR